MLASRVNVVLAFRRAYASTALRALVRSAGAFLLYALLVARLARGSLRWSTSISAPLPRREGIGTHIVDLSTGDLGVAAQYAASVASGSTTRTWLGRIGAADR